MRTELTRTIDTRINATNTTLRQEFRTGLTQFESRLTPEAFRTNTIVRPGPTVINT